MRKALIMLATIATLGTGIVAAAPASADGWHHRHDRGYNHHWRHDGPRYGRWDHHRYRDHHRHWHDRRHGYYGR